MVGYNTTKLNEIKEINREKKSYRWLITNYAQLLFIDAKTSSVNFFFFFTSLGECLYLIVSEKIEFYQSKYAESFSQWAIFIITHRLVSSVILFQKFESVIAQEKLMRGASFNTKYW